MAEQSTVMGIGKHTLRDDTDERVVRLSQLLQVPLPYAIGIVESLRLIAAEYTPAELNRRHTEGSLTVALGFPAEFSKTLFDALENVGWIERAQQGLFFKGRRVWQKDGQHDS